ncbi:hypothetical protein SAMN06265795_1491 [Noviherbaspirillum humi]|uniref:Uncharacterized protein n=1 Tax=Noviherbaspirillum humi TaxID=1688639 RepID=A0A239MEM3_9BURK|nr:hypothetical protein SAMN06265795_1491 [Noviherbaspirillum humi]
MFCMITPFKVTNDAPIHYCDVAAIDHINANNNE